MEWIVDPLASFKNITILEIAACCKDKTFYTDSCLKGFAQCNGTATLTVQL